MRGETGVGRPSDEQEQSPFEELKDPQYDLRSGSRCRGDQVWGSDIGEAGSPDGTGACKMDLSPLSQAIVHC